MRKISFTVKGRIPSKKNGQEIRRHGSTRFISANAKYEKWEESAMNQLLARGIPKSKLKVDMTELRFYFPDKRKADLYNKAESIADMMTKYGIMEDDNWLCTGPVMMFPYHDKEDPRCEITLWVA